MLIVSPHSSATAEQKLAIVGIDLGSGINDENGGFYNTLNGTLVEGLATLQTRPQKRAVSEFNRKLFHCIHPINLSGLAAIGGTVQDAIQSDAITEIKSHLFSAPGRPAITDLDQLNGLVLAMSAGVPAKPLIGDREVKVIYAQDGVKKLRLLLRSRVDAMVGWAPDVFINFASAGVAPTQYSPSLVLYQLENRIVCHNSTAGRMLMQTVNRRIKEVRDSGRLNEILTSYGIPTTS